MVRLISHLASPHPTSTRTEMLVQLDESFSLLPQQRAGSCYHEFQSTQVRNPDPLACLKDIQLRWNAKTNTVWAGSTLWERAPNEDWARVQYSSSTIQHIHLKGYGRWATKEAQTTIKKTKRTNFKLESRQSRAKGGKMDSTKPSSR